MITVRRQGSLSKLIGKHVLFEWGDEQEEALDVLKDEP